VPAPVPAPAPAPATPWLTRSHGHTGQRRAMRGDAHCGGAELAQLRDGAAVGAAECGAPASGGGGAAVGGGLSGTLVDAGLGARWARLGTARLRRSVRSVAASAALRGLGGGERADGAPAGGLGNLRRRGSELWRGHAGARGRSPGAEHGAAEWAAGESWGAGRDRCGGAGASGSAATLLAGGIDVRTGAGAEFLAGGVDGSGCGGQRLGAAAGRSVAEGGAGLGATARRICSAQGAVPVAERGPDASAWGLVGSAWGNDLAWGRERAVRIPVPPYQHHGEHRTRPDGVCA
jgi:hypothetical protein